MSRYLFFCHTGGADAGHPVPLALGYVAHLWRPAGTDVRPPGAPLLTSLVWWMFHRCHVFANRDYCVLVILTEGMVVHRSSVFPRYFRFPFMADADLQVGDTWTDPSHRGRGLASCALRDVLGRLGAPGRQFWYLTDAPNIASVRAAERAGFLVRGTGSRTSRWGLRFLGAYRIEEQQ